MRALTKAALAAMFAVTAPLVQAAPDDDAAPTAPISTIYDLYLGGIKAGELTIDASYNADRYNAFSVLRTAGIVGAVYKASFEAETQGRMTESGLVPDRFSANSRMKKKRQAVEMLFDGDAPKSVTAEPAFIPKPWEVEPSEQSGTVDPITAAIAHLAPMPRAHICNRSVEVFDGRRRYAIDMGQPIQDKERIKCPAKYRRIAGFKPKMMKKSPEFPFNIWLEERADGKAHVVRAAGESMFGLAVILLRK
ncbi:MAG: DUF3108 domain-containing protein [Pseudomonadota bacterium]